MNVTIIIDAWPRPCGKTFLKVKDARTVHHTVPQVCDHTGTCRLSKVQI